MQNKVLNYPMAQKITAIRFYRVPLNYKLMDFTFTKPSFVLNVMAVV